MGGLYVLPACLICLERSGRCHTVICQSGTKKNLTQADFQAALDRFYGRKLRHTGGENVDGSGWGGQRGQS